MAVSSLTRELREMRCPPRATNTAASNPPKRSPKGDSPIKIAAKARPGRSEWERASAMRASRRMTTNAPRNPFVNPTSTQASRARSMKSYWKGSRIQFMGGGDARGR